MVAVVVVAPVRVLAAAVVVLAEVVAVITTIPAITITMLEVLLVALVAVQETQAEILVQFISAVPEAVVGAGEQPEAVHPMSVVQQFQIALAGEQ